MVGLNMVCYISLWLNVGKGLNWKLSGQKKGKDKDKCEAIMLKAC